MTTPETTDDATMATSAAETTAEATAEASAAAVALTAALEAIEVLHADALDAIADLAEAWEFPADDHQVLRMAERPTLAARPEAAAA